MNVFVVNDIRSLLLCENEPYIQELARYAKFIEEFYVGRRIEPEMQDYIVDTWNRILELRNKDNTRVTIDLFLIE